MKINAAQFAAIIGRTPQYVSLLLDKGLPAKRSGRRGVEVELDLGPALHWWHTNTTATARPWGQVDRDYGHHELREEAPVWLSTASALYGLPGILRKAGVDDAAASAILDAIRNAFKAQLVEGGRHPLEAEFESQCLFNDEEEDDHDDNQDERQQQG